MIVLVDNGISVKDIVTETLHIVDSGIIEFYRLMAVRSELLSYNTILNRLFASISDNIITRLETPWYLFWKQQKLTNEARKSLAMAYTLFVEYENVLLSHKKLRVSFQEQIKENTFLSNFSPYLLEHSQHDSEMPDSYKDSISHFEKEVHLFNNLKVIIFASISGAILGSILTAILTASLSNKTTPSGDNALNKGIITTVTRAVIPAQTIKDSTKEKTVLIDTTKKK